MKKIIRYKSIWKWFIKLLFILKPIIREDIIEKKIGNEIKRVQNKYLNKKINNIKKKLNWLRFNFLDRFKEFKEKE